MSSSEDYHTLQMLGKRLTNKTLKSLGCPQRNIQRSQNSENVYDVGNKNAGCENLEAPNVEHSCQFLGCPGLPEIIL